MPFRRFDNLVLLAALALFAGCRSKIDAHVNHSPEQPAVATPDAPPPAPEVQPPQPPAPVDVKNALTSGRVRYQTRQSIRLELTPAIVGNGGLYTLQNAAAVPLVTAQDFAADHAAGDGYAYASPTLALFPSSPALKGKLVYGANQLKLLVVDDATEPRFTTASFVLKDFTVFEVGTAHFAEPRQIQGGFQGGFVPYTGKLLAPGGAGLMTGATSLINR